MSGAPGPPVRGAGPPAGFPWRAAVRFSLLLALLAAGLLLLRWEPVAQAFEAERLAAWLERFRHAAWAPGALVAIYVVVSPLGLPVSPLILAGGAVFGPAWGSLLNIVGTLLGAVVSFLLARALGRDLLVQWLGSRLARLETLAEQRGFWPLVRLRFVPFPFFVVNFGAALAGVRFSTFLAASAVGLVPAMIVYTYFGAALARAAAEGARPDAVVHVVVALALLLALTWLPTAWRTWGRSLGRRLAVVAATIGGNLYLVAGSALFATLTLLTFWIPPPGAAVFLWARTWATGVLLSSGIRLDVEREAALDPGRRYIFMANHESLFDIPALLRTLPVPAGFLAKRSLFRIPLFGWALRAGGYVSVDRRDPGAARRAFTRALERLEAKVSVAIFPEERRTDPGELLPFKKGGFLLALRSGLPIVPVGLEGAAHIQPKGSLLIRPRRLRVRYGRPIPVDGLRVEDRAALMARVRGEIARLAGIRPEVPPSS